MLQQKLLAHVLSVLEQCSIEYMVTGSVASSLQGEPRTSHDIDIVVNLLPASIPSLVHAFSSPQFYLSAESITEAIKQEGSFNLIDTTEGDKVDFWVLTKEPFDQSRFQRRKRQNVFGIWLYVSQPEDTILMKLRWSKESGGSEKQFGDAVRVYELQYGNLNQEYMDQWIPLLHVEDLWNRLQREAKPLI